MDVTNKYIFASKIDALDLKSNDVFMTVAMKMFNTSKNRNGVIVTEAFIDDVVANAADYLGMPLCADTKKLKAGDYRGLGHMLDAKTGRFLSEIIGAFISFEKEIDENGASLIGVARIAKRNEKVCSAIEEIYESGDLNFSFEILASDVSISENTITVDVSDNNKLAAMAVVSIPAYPEAKALALAAELNGEADLFAATTIISEVDFGTIRERLRGALYKMYGDEMWYTRTLLVGIDFLILYHEVEGKSYKLEYRVEDDEIAITDFYEIAYERKGGRKDMDLDQAMAKIAELEDKISTIESAAASNVEAIQAESEAVLNEANSRIAEFEARVAELEQSVAEVETLKAENETLLSSKEELETIKAERVAAEVETKKEALRVFASKNGLDIEDAVVAEAIENVDYETLVAETLKKETPKENTFIASFSEMKVSASDFNGLFERVQ